MITLFHYPLFAACRFIRLIFEEYNEKYALIEEKPWLKRKEFILLNHAGSLPFLLAEQDAPISGFFPILEYLDETRGVLKGERRLFPQDVLLRAEIRRIIDWCLIKMENEVTRYIVQERVLKIMFREGDTSPDSACIRSVRLNIKQHMKYINWLAAHRNWLAGPSISYADFAAGASLSVLDYLGEIDWSLYEAACEWYRKMKSRRSFRPLLSDRISGVLPVAHYTDLDF